MAQYSKQFLAGILDIRVFLILRICGLMKIELRVIQWATFIVLVAIIST